MKWVKYLKIKFKHLGRGWEEGDCFNMLQLFHREELGIEVEDFTGYEFEWDEQGHNFFLDMYEERGFAFVDEPEFGDVILFNIGGIVCHCGIVLDDTYFIHTHSKGTSIANYRVGLWHRRTHGFIRHRSRLEDSNED